MRTTSFDEVRRLAVELGRRLEEEGRSGPAATLEAAAGESEADPEALLVLRSALIITRNDWSAVVDEETEARASQILNAAKRLSIEM